MRARPPRSRAPRSRALGIAAASLLAAIPAAVAPPCSAVAARHPGHGLVRGWVSSGDRTRLLEPQAPVRTRHANGPADVVVGDARRQRMDGAGAALTDSSAWNMWTHMTPEARHRLLIRLFDHRRGAGIDMVRLVIGAADFARYSYT